MGELIQYETHKWLVMRDAPMNPKAVIERVTDSHGDARYLVFAWDYEPTKRRMMGLYPNIQEAVMSVPWPKRSEEIDHNGYPPGTTQRAQADRRLSDPHRGRRQEGVVSKRHPGPRPT